jgi:hypothetical protein
MSTFDPRDWIPSGWARDRERRPQELDREVVGRWLTALAFCLCFAALAPSGLFLTAFAGLLLVAGLASAGLALIRGDPVLARHLTAWDEAAWSLALGLALALWLGPA